MKTNPVPMTEVLAWLAETHPALHQSAEVERAWLWLTTDLRGDQNKATRDSIKENGFRFAKRGHTLPSGKVAFWAHSCSHPIGFRRNGSGGAKRKPQGKTDRAASLQRPDPLANTQRQTEDLSELAAVFA